MAVLSNDIGIAAEYWSWRGYQVALGAWCLIQMAFVFFFLPETAHLILRKREQDEGKGPVKSLLSINPFRSLGLLRSPNLVLMVSGLP